MALPFQTNNIMSAIMSYTAQTVPVNINIPTVPQVAHMIPAVTAAVINEAGIKANQNPIRTFCYNMIVNNFFNNKELIECVTLVLDMLTLGLMKRTFSSPEQALIGVTEQAMSLYSSSLVVQYRELEMLIGPHLVAQAHNSNNALYNIKQDINRMYMDIEQSSQNNYMASNYPQQQPMGMGMGFQQPMQQPMHQFNQPMGMNRPQLQPSQMNAFNASGGAPMPRQVHGTLGVNQGRHFDKKRTQVQEVAPVTQPVVEVKEPPVTQETQPDSDLHKPIGSTMDREQHRTVFFDTFQMNQNRVRKHNQQAIALEQEVIATSLPVEDDDFEEVVPVGFVYPSWIYDNFLETAISEGIIKKLSHGEEGIFRTFNIVAKPFVCNYDLKPYTDIIKTSTNFIMLASKMKLITSNLNTEPNLDKADAVITYLSYLDNLFTKILNDFLMYNINPGGKIESFTADVATLRYDLNNAFGKEVAAALDKKESEVIDTLFNLEVDLTKPGKDNSIGLNISIADGLFSATMPINYSFTYLNITDKELGIISEGNNIVIDKEVMPDLWSIIHSLGEHKKSMNATTIEDLLFTSDGVQYRLFTSYTNNDYKIVKL